MSLAKLKRFFTQPSRAELARRLAVVTEERDVLEERVYDLTWHLNRVRREFDADCC